MAGEAVSALTDELCRRYLRATGQLVTTQYGLGPAIKKRVESSEPCDVVVLSTGHIENLCRQGLLLPTTTLVAQAGLGVGVRAGSAKPDVGSPNRLKRVLLEAKAISYAPDNTTGQHLGRVFERLGIAAEVKAKARPQQVSAAQGILRGEAELGLGLSPTFLDTDGIEFAGHLPAELQLYLVFAAGVSAASRQADAAQALIAHFAAADSIAAMQAMGWSAPTGAGR